MQKSPTRGHEEPEIQYTVDGDLPEVKADSVLVQFKTTVRKKTIPRGEGKPVEEDSIQTFLNETPAINTTAQTDTHFEGRSVVDKGPREIESARRRLNTQPDPAADPVVFNNVVGEITVTVTVIGSDGTPCSASDTKSFTYSKLATKE